MNKVIKNFCFVLIFAIATLNQVGANTSSDDSMIAPYIETQELKDKSTKNLATLKMVKSDCDNNSRLAGVVFRLYDVGFNLIGEYTTDENGEIRISDVAPDTRYYWQEISSLYGYTFSTAMLPVTTRPNVSSVYIVCNRLERSNITIVKEDFDTGDRLEGAKFKIYGTANGVYTEYYGTTNSNGTIVTPTLIPGTYSVEEITAPVGYQILTNPLTLVVNKGGQSQNKAIFVIKNRKAETYTVSYNGNKQTKGMAPIDNNRYVSDDLVVVKDKNTLSKDNYDFVNWNTQANGKGTSYAVGSKFKIKSNMVLYAQYEHKKASITFDTKGGSPIPKKIVKKIGSTVDLNKIANPKKSGYVFAGWYYGNKKYSGVITVPNRNLNLSAKWYKEYFKGNNIVISKKDFSIVNKSFIKKKGNLKIWSVDSTKSKRTEKIKLMDISGIENKVGSYAITITSDGGTKYKIYLIVGENSEPVVNEHYALESNDFEISLSDYRKAVDEGRIGEEILSRSKSRAWHIKTNEMIDDIHIGDVTNYNKGLNQSSSITNKWEKDLENITDFKIISKSFDY